MIGLPFPFGRSLEREKRAAEVFSLEICWTLSDDADLPSTQMKRRGKGKGGRRAQALLFIFLGKGISRGEMIFLCRSYE